MGISAGRARSARKIAERQRLIRVAAGVEEADLVLRHATYVNVFSNELCHGDIAIAGGRIAGIGAYQGRETYDVSGMVVAPGLIDAHIHLESTLVTPWEFAGAAVSHGTCAVVADPHEIANVMGSAGIEYMLAATRGLPLDVFFMLPSCVPATPWDESGAKLSLQDISRFLPHARVLGLGEVMDYEGVLRGDTELLGKITAALACKKVADGHGPGLSGHALSAYMAAGISSDHECTTLKEGLEKLRGGQTIMIREGTAARNLEALLPILAPPYADRCLLCTDDRHPEDLVEKGHMDSIVQKAVAGGVDPVLAIKAASYNAARHFRMDARGAVAPGYAADLLVADSLKDFNVKLVFKQGDLVFDGGRVIAKPPRIPKRLRLLTQDTFRLPPVNPDSFRHSSPLPVIGLVNGQIITESMGFAGAVDLERDIVKAAVIERHHNTGHIGLGMLHGYGLKRGAVATSIAHDAHNITVVGTNETDMAVAANRVAQCGGAMVAVAGGQVLQEVELPIAGLFSGLSIAKVNDQLRLLKRCAFNLGVNPGIDPLMTLGFISLPVIPRLRLLTMGVFDVTAQAFISGERFM